MTRTRNPPASRKQALAPDITALDERARRAWTERMEVRPLEDDRYLVDGEHGTTYVVDVKRGRCTCPDRTIRGERCKHLRRVAIEINLDRVPPPGKRFATCDACGATAVVEPGASRPHLCADCRLDPGEYVVDRESGDAVRVVAVTDYRADEVEIPEQGCTVASHPTNRGYDPDDLVVDVMYPDPGADDRQRIYSFPLSRLERRADATDGQSTLPEHATPSGRS